MRKLNVSPFYPFLSFVFGSKTVSEEFTETLVSKTNRICKVQKNKIPLLPSGNYSLNYIRITVFIWSTFNYYYTLNSHICDEFSEDMSCPELCLSGNKVLSFWLVELVETNNKGNFMILIKWCLYCMDGHSMSPKLCCICLKITKFKLYLVSRLVH